MVLDESWCYMLGANSVVIVSAVLVCCVVVV